MSDPRQKSLIFSHRHRLLRAQGYCEGFWAGDNIPPGPLCRASEIVGFGEETGKIVLLVDDAATGAGGFALTERFACGWDRSDVMYWAAPLGAVKSVESSGPFFTLNG